LRKIAGGEGPGPTYNSWRARPRRPMGPALPDSATHFHSRPPEKSDRLMVGLTATRRGNPTRLLAHSRWVFAPGNGGAANAPGFQKKGWPTFRLCAHQETGRQSWDMAPCFGRTTLGGGGWPCETTVKAGRVFLIRIGSGLRRFAYSGQRLEVDLLSPLSVSCSSTPRITRLMTKGGIEDLRLREMVLLRLYIGGPRPLLASYQGHHIPAPVRFQRFTGCPIRLARSQRPLSPARKA
jgi:hypothetical protein